MTEVQTPLGPSLDGTATVDTTAAGLVAIDAAVATHAALADPHTGYVLESLADTKGDIYTASADNTPAKLAAGTNGYVLTALSSEATGLIWAANTESTVAKFGIVGAVGVAAGLQRWYAPQNVAWTIAEVRASVDTAPVGTPMIIDVNKSTLVSEVQTLNMTAGISAETFKLTWNTHESSAAVTLPAGGYVDITAAQIKTCLLTISDFAVHTASIAVVKTSNAYAITFSGQLKGIDLGAITVTSKVGAADGSVTATTAGSTTLTTIFTTQTNRPEILDTGFTALAPTIEVTSLAAGEFLEVDVDQVGSGTAGSNLSVQIALTRTL